ncbi:MAG: restriction endonuclease subunit S [Candidatus Cloacimonetes bacterium]|nr:restriction endonuclease subunit S [Candidatus Cloacimonadota bacterium]
MKLEEIIKIYRPNTTSRVDLSIEGIKCIHYGDIYKNYSNKSITSSSIINSFTKTIKSEKIINSDSIIFPDVTETVEDFGHFVYVQFDNVNYINGTHTFALTTTECNLKYLFYYLQSVSTKAKLRQLLKGDTVFQLSAKDFLKLDISNFHTINFQQHIVDTIGSIDDLIENLNTINCKINDLIQIIFRKHTHHLNTTRIGNLKGYSIIKSGIKTFSGTKVYLNTASVNENGISSNDYIITMKDKPSRANMQPIPNSVWFAKLKDSPKFLYVRDFMEYILNNYIFSTGFMGLVCDNSYVSNYMYSLITSKQFDENKNALSIGATMQGINNDSFKEIQVPNVNINLMTTIGKEAESKIKFIYYNKKKIERLTLLKKNYLKKFFG